MQADRGQPAAFIADESIAAAAKLDQRLVQMPAARKQIRQTRPAHEARETAVAPRDLFGGGAEQDHGVGSGKPALRPEGEFALARPQFDLERAQRHAERGDAAADRRQRRIDLIETRFGQILVALRERAHVGRLRRPARVLRRQPRILQLEEMKFDLEAGEEIEAGRCEHRKRVAEHLPRRERHRLAVGEIDVAKQPAGIWRPRQHAKRRRVGHHDEVAAALHLRHVEAAAGGEHRIDRLVRGVLSEQRRRHGDAALQHGGRIFRHHGLAAQHAVLIGEREANEFQLVFLDGLLDGLGVTRLLVGPQAVTLDEA